ncbi:hypothetical protein L7F22_010615, partial [Adiantum nelumboides]|nr:hypothetical protein [Adiantum nelumboides]
MLMAAATFVDPTLRDREGSERTRCLGLQHHGRHVCVYIGGKGPVAVTHQKAYEEGGRTSVTITPRYVVMLGGDGFLLNAKKLRLHHGPSGEAKKANDRDR